MDTSVHEEDATGIADQVWTRLVEPDGAWRTPVLATCDADLGADARSIVLRDADPGRRLLYFYTARDADKVRQLTRDSRCTLVVYDSEQGFQARLYGRATPVLDQTWMDRAWQKLADWQQAVYSLQRRIRGKENFAAYEIRVDAMHLLWLRDDGQNKAIEMRWNDIGGATLGDAAGWIARAVEP